MSVAPSTLIGASPRPPTSSDPPHAARPPLACRLNPTTQNFVAISHTKIEVISLGIKVLMTVVSTFLSGNLILMSVFQAILSFWLASLYIQWLPHTFNALNIARSGSFASIFYCALCLFVMAIHPGIAVNDLEAFNSFRTAVTTAMWAGLAPAALVGAALAWWRVHFFSVTVMDRWVTVPRLSTPLLATQLKPYQGHEPGNQLTLTTSPQRWSVLANNRFRTAPQDAKSKTIYKFTDPREVEIMMRCCRHWATAYK